MTKIVKTLKLKVAVSLSQQERD